MPMQMPSHAVLWFYPFVVDSQWPCQMHQMKIFVSLNVKILWSKSSTILCNTTTPQACLERNHPALRRYKQIWPQLKIIEGFVSREYHPSPSSGLVTGPILQTSLHHQALLRNHNIHSAGHQGMEKTLERLRLKAYWANIGWRCWATLPGMFQVSAVKISYPNSRSNDKHSSWLPMADDCCWCLGSPRIP